MYANFLDFCFWSWILAPKLSFFTRTVDVNCQSANNFPRGKILSGSVELRAYLYIKDIGGEVIPANKEK